MADAIISVVAKRVISLIEEQARHHINLVRGAEEKVRSLAVDLQTIRNVLDDAENKRFKDKSINYWLSRLEHTVYEMEDVLDEWDYALLKLQMEERRSEGVVASPKQKVCSFIPSSSCFKKIAVRHNVGKKILIVKEKLDEILKEKDQYGLVISQPSVDPSHESWRVQSTSIFDLTKVHGRDRERDLLVTKLIDKDGSQQELGFHILSIVGTGGLGKTTLAQMVYNHSRVEESFELRIWVCVSDPFDLTSIVKGILESIEKGSSPNTNHLDILFKHVQKFISKKRFLLVLDDVWTEDSDKWEPLENSLRCGGAGSKILVTSRSERVVKMMGARESDICRPGLLSDEECWSLMCRMALSGRDEVEFEDIGKKIARKCKGLPLAAKTLGSLLRFKGSLEQWKNILDSKIWELEEVEIDMFPHLLLSYTELSPTLKRCFSYCAVFPKDAYINVALLIKDWMALGYLGTNVDDMELKGRNYFDVLAMRSLFQDFEKGNSNEIQLCKMHDIIHDFAQFLRKRGRMEAKEMKKGTTCRVCDPSRVSWVNEFLTFYNRNSFPNLCHCLVRLRVLRFCGKSISQGMETLIHLRRLDLQEITKLSYEDLKAIFQLYHMQTLTLRDCGIEEIPKEIGNLIHLSFLDLSQNRFLKELPTEIGNLICLKHLGLVKNKALKELPKSMCDLQELRTLDNEACDDLCTIPERLLPKLREYPVGIGGIKLELLKNLKHLHGLVRLNFRLDGKRDGDLNEVVQDAWKTDMRNEMGIKIFEIHFKDEMDKDGSSSLWIDVMDSLQPHPNLNELIIWHYGGSKLPRWMLSPLNQLRSLGLGYCKHMTLLPPFGKLPCLEEISLWNMESMEVVGRELLGLTTEDREGEDVIAFPKLKMLAFWFSDKWKVWEDITVEEAEEESSIMPCLVELLIRNCNGLRMLPHRLLHKVSSLKKLDISRSPMLLKRYGDKEGSDWKSISINNPDLHLIMW